MFVSGNKKSILFLERQKKRDLSQAEVLKTRKTIKKSKITYWFLVGLVALLMVYFMIPLIAKDDGLGAYGHRYEIAVHKNQKLREIMDTEVVGVTKFDGNFQPGLEVVVDDTKQQYWIFEIVGIQADDRVVGTYDGNQFVFAKDNIIGVYDSEANVMGHIYYLSIQWYGFVLLLVFWGVLFYTVYHYLIRKKKLLLPVEK